MSVEKEKQPLVLDNESNKCLFGSFVLFVTDVSMSMPVSGCCCTLPFVLFHQLRIVKSKRPSNWA